MNILIVDDEEAFSEIGRLILERAGFTVRTVSSAVEALPLIEQSTPDMVLSDVEMPGIDGFELLRRIRADARFKNLPFILMSARRNYPTDRVSGLNLGGDDYVSKPFSGDELVSRVKAVLRRAGTPAAPSLPAGLAAGGGAKISDAEFIAALENAPPPPAARRAASAAPVSTPSSPAAGPARMASDTLPILAELQRRLSAKEAVSTLFINLSFFRGYNACYGFQKGDAILRATLVLLEKGSAAVSQGQDPVGHLGGDDFLVLTAPERASAFCHAVLKAFDQGVAAFYDEADRERGFIEHQNRLKKAVAFPFMSIVIGVASTQRKGMVHMGQFFQVGRELLRYAKTLGGSRFVVDRRKDPAPGA